jgi:tetratricopeptide (TPR) repeat protein
MLPPPSMLTIKNRAMRSEPRRVGHTRNACRRVRWKEVSKVSGHALALVVGVSLLAGGCTPAGPRALLEGKRLIERRDYAQAIEELRTATSLLATNAQAWNYLGLAYHYAGRPVEAEKAYQQALALNRDLSEAHYNLGCLLLEQNRTNSAKNELTAFTLRRANSVDGFVKLGIAQIRARDWNGAEKSFNDAVRLNPHDAAALNGVGLVRVQRGRAAEAVQAFNSVLKEHPDYRPALLNLAIVTHQYLKDRATALRAYQAYVGLKPPPEDAEMVKNVLQQLEREISQPARPAATNPIAHSITNAVTPKPNLEPARLAAAPKAEPVTNELKVAPPVSLPPTNQYELVHLPAEPVLKPAQDVAEPLRDTPAEPVRVAASPSNAVSDPKTTKRGFIQRVNPLNLFRTESKPQPTPSTRETNLATPGLLPTAGAEGLVEGAGSARYAYRSPSRPNPGNRAEAQPWFNRGVQAQQAQRLTDALQAYKRATELDPAFFEALYNLGLVTTETGDSSAACAAYENALAVRPDSVDARYNFALVLKHSNFLPDAIHELERIVAAHPDEARAHLALGNLYAQQLNQPGKAREQYLKVLESDPRHPQAGAIRFWLTANP